MCILLWKYIFTCGFLCHLCFAIKTLEEFNIEALAGFKTAEELSYTSTYKCPIGSDFTYACPSTKAADKSLVCIHESWLCDQDPDCPQGEDEGTAEGEPCHNLDIDICTDSEQFQCKDDTSLCIPKTWMCDGDLDCDDGSDENKENCKAMGMEREGPHVENIIPCTPNQLQCSGSHTCIPLSKVCDFTSDCDSRSDEYACSNENCGNVDCGAGECVETADGARCYCDDGYYFEKNTSSCSDLNECLYEQYCDQPSHCSNSEGSFTCSCADGYELTNKTHCKAINDPQTLEATILITNFWDVRQFSIQGKQLSPSFLKVDQRVVAMDFDHRENKVYWIAYNGNTGKSSLHYTTATTPGPTDTIAMNVQLSTVDSFAIDWIQKNFYFADNILLRVSLCAKDGVHCVVIAGGEVNNEDPTTTLVGPRSIVLSPSEGYIFISDWNADTSKILRANLDGSSLTPIVTTKLVKPIGLSIDHVNKHLYFADMDLNVVERIDFAGTDNTRRIIAIGLKVEYIYSISVFENYLYLSDRHENQVIKIHRYDYGVPPVTLHGNLSRPGQIHVYHRQRQPDVTNNPCEDQCNSPAICTVKSDAGVLQKQCLCPTGTTGDSCEVDTSCTNMCSKTECTYIPQHCSLAVCQSNQSFCLETQQCLPSSWWCDGKVDCPSGDDEGLYCSYAECDMTQFQCASGSCVDMTYHCDGHADCDDNSDELNCKATNCDSPNMFVCQEDSVDSANRCVPKIFVCDGHWDCVNGTDESAEQCDAFHFDEDCNLDEEFQCRNGQCIALSWKCDGDPDCADESDEGVEMCREDMRTCRENETQCDSQDKCIPSDWFCDGEPDCLDRSDESVKHCPDAIFHCKKPGMKHCHRNGTQICIPPERVCDQKPDCDDASDEGGSCSENKCSSSPSPCGKDQVCHVWPAEGGYKCVCQEGEKFNTSGKCIPSIPVTELCNQWGVCGQMCKLDNSTKKGYRCTCKTGFFLEPDQFTCKPQESDPVYVVFSNRHELRRVNTATHDAISLISGLRNTIALDFYYNNAGQPVLFWTDVMEDKIYRGTMVGNALINVQAIVSSGLATTEGVAVDWIGENIYWVESSLDQIEVARVDGTKRTTLIAGNMSSPRAIAVDPLVGKLFWTDWDGHQPRIEVCAMSGENRMIIHKIDASDGGGWPNGLTLDYDFQRLYWIDARSESIHTLKYDGTDPRLVLKEHMEMAHPFAMSLFGNYVYWTDWSTNSVVRANKFNGSDVHAVQKTITQPFDLQVIHPQRQPYRNNPCAINNGGCDSLCLLHSADDSVRCKCAHRMKLDDNGKCKQDKKFLLFVKNNEIRGVDLQQGHFNVIPVITIPHVDKPTAIDYDVDSDMLYWADKGLNVINRANFSANVETLIDKGLSNPEGFAIDWLSGNMYFSSYDLDLKTASISVATLSGTFRTELIKENISRPQSIALHPFKGWMFFTDVHGEPGTHKLFRSRMDGSESNVLIPGLSNPTSLSLDLDEDMIYFINAEKIHKYNLDGKPNAGGPVVNIGLETKPETLTVTSEYIYVSTGERIVSVKKKSNNEIKELRDATPHINALLMYDSSTRKKGSYNPCHGDNNCSQLCLPTSQEISLCKCTAGFDLDKTDNASCKGITSFLLYAKETEIRGQMFFAESTHEALPPISQIQSASAVDFYAEEDMIYWVDTKANSISRIKRDLTRREVIIRDGINSVEGLAVDWIAKTIYWTDAGHSTIEMSRLNGSDRYVVASGDMEKPRSIVVHPVLGQLFWSDWGTEARIERANLDGSERVQYVYTDIARPWGLTIDYDNHDLYWCDSEKKSIEVINLMTNARKIILKRSDSFQMDPISLTVIENVIYWIDGMLENSAIYSVSTKNTTDVKLIRPNLGKELKDIKAFDKTRQIGTNDCQVKNGGCENLCFYVGYKKVQCACSFGKLKNESSCEDYDGFLVYSKVTDIESINLNDPNNKNQPIPPIKNDTMLRNVIGLSFDYANDLIFYSDIVRGDIQAYDRKTKKSRVIVDGIGSAEGLAFVNGDIFWTSYTNSCISKINVKEAGMNKSVKPEVVVQMDKLDHPRAIAVDACWNLIYWTNWNNEKPRIQRSNLTGHLVEDVIIKDILTPNGLTIDHLAKKLYWSDARLDKIERCNMDGSNRQIILTTIPQHSFGLVIYGNYLFWTDWMLRAVIRANKYDGTGVIWLRKNLERQPMGIIAFANDSSDCTLHACHDNKFGCEDLCFTTEKGEPFCQCRYGRLKADGKTCASLVDCTNVGYEAFPCLTGYCLPFAKSCDGVMDCADNSDEAPHMCKNRECPATMHPCANRTEGQCIALSKKCNGEVDCIDGSDEVTSLCGCPPQNFACKNGECIPKIFRCNGKDNKECTDGSDEVGCDVAVPCAEGMFQCKYSGECIPGDHRCDNKRDCGDASDEDDCNTTLTCDSTMKQCTNGECIHENWWCDRDEDCEDGSDEVDCSYTCKDGQFSCTDKTCIDKNWACDGHADCEDASDEKNCTSSTCDTSMHQCKNGQCIESGWVCDQELDCIDGSDEGPDGGCPVTECEDGEFECANYRCIDEEFVCDQDDDCLDNSDEPDSCVYSGCNEDEKACWDNTCIAKSLFCDGKQDCSDGEDELPMMCSNVAMCNATQFMCQIMHSCIKQSAVCDHVRDCEDGTDESADCFVNECDTLKPCSHVCTDDQIGYTCSCPSGFKLQSDNKTCADIDECSTEFPCSHFCFNTLGSYYCSCAEGYKLESDRHHCALADPKNKPFLLVSNRYHIQKVYLDGGEPVSIVENLTHSVAIDFHYEEEMIYWTDVQSQSSTINRIALNHTEGDPKQVLHSSTVLNPDGMAVDWVGGNLYWCDRNTDTIEVSKLDGRYRKILLRDKSFLREPRALELFPKYGYLFLTDWGDEPHISRLTMDGAMRRKIITENIAWPNALTIDYVTEKIFWADANFDYIAMADLDGENRHMVIDKNLPHTFAMTTFMDKIYWTDWETNRIHEAEKFSGEKRTALSSLTHRPMDLVVYHQLRQPQLSRNPCKELSCSHLCLLRPKQNPWNETDTVEAVCACPENHYMKDGKCIDNCDKSQMLCNSSSRCIPRWWRCDGHKDCEDGEDESNCGKDYHYHCTQPGMFQCTHATDPSQCFPPLAICDNVTDCADSSDETSWNNCKDYPCKLGNQFKCEADNKCINGHKKCDGIQDCSDGMDEKNCTKQQCLETQFTCATSGNCIPYLWQCDGEVDCGDGGEDEKDCVDRECKEGYIKCNKSHKCIPVAWKCDGESDCGLGDDSDEPVQECTEKTCDADHWMCHNSHCIPNRWKCDDDVDCGDGSDEKDCPTKVCEANEFTCTGGNRCIPNSARCDGRMDCNDNSDERNCTKKDCGSEEFHCQKDNVCVPGTWQCDGEQDCIDGADEANCTHANPCNVGEFRCNTSTECMSLLWRCDGERDCVDDSDEQNCRGFACPAGRFRCPTNGVCIPDYKKCDGNIDCPGAKMNMSDEADSICKSSTCLHGQYKCNDDRRCIKFSHVCDGKQDCDDNSDENICEKGDLGPCGILNGGCDGICTYLNKIQRTKCSCKSPEVLAEDERSCVYMDQCKLWGTCPQNCNASALPPCSCYDGYEQEHGDTFRCKANGETAKLIFADESTLFERKLHEPHDGSRKELSISFANYTGDKIISLDADSTSSNEILLFMIKRRGKDKILTTQTVKLNTKKDDKSDLKGRNTREAPAISTNRTLAKDIVDPTDIAADWIGRKLYWTDLQMARIEMCTYDLQKPRTVIKTGLSKPFGITVDPNYGRIFYTDYGYMPKIASALLDGSDQKTLVSANLIFPTGIAVDDLNQRIYFADTKRHTVESVDYDGNNRQIVKTFNASDPPLMIDVFEDHLVVTTYRNKNLISFPKFFNKTTDNVTMLSEHLRHMGGITVIQQYKQLITNDASHACEEDRCNSGQTRQMCINIPSNSTQPYTCVCPDGAVYSKTDKMCNFDCPRDYCKHGQKCIINNNDEPKCLCSMGFRGKYCETDLCYKYCGGGGTCLISPNNNSVVEAHCTCSPHYTGERCEIFLCDGYCLNGGLCDIDNSGTRTCRCFSGYTGVRCENQLSEDSYCSGYCQNGGTCKVLARGIKSCTCTENYKGAQCEQCEQSLHECANSGVCTWNTTSQESQCHCRPGFDPLSNCEQRTCKGYCLNEALCTLRNNQPFCKCSAGFLGERCEKLTKECKDIVCKNGGVCMNGNTVGGHTYCKCPAQYTGSFCETDLCGYVTCLNGGNCTIGETGGNPYCVCPGKYTGQSCEIGSICKSPLFEGPHCNRSICHDYCVNDGTCVGCHLTVNKVGECRECECLPHHSGIRCQITHPKEQAEAAKGSMAPIIIPIVVVLCVLLAIILFVIIRKKRGPFKHSRLKDNSLNVSNPIYMPQTTEDSENEDDESHQPLDQPFDFDPEKSTNFANPVYEQFYANSRQTLLPKDDESEDEENGHA